jgi:hypothetical protein
MKTHMNQRSAAVLVAAAVLLAACSGNSAEKVSGESLTTSGGTGSTRSSRQLPSAEKIVNEPDARKDVTLAGCSSQDGGWRATGKIKNAKKESSDYTIVISFTNEKSTVLARSVEKVTVPPGRSKSWEADARFQAPKDVVCVLRGVDRS